MRDKNSRWVLAILGLIIIGVGVTLWMGRGTVKHLSQAETDAIIAPLADSDQSYGMGRLNEKARSPFAENMRAIYASLPDNSREQVKTKGKYDFHLSDLPKEQADIIKGFVENDKDCVYPTLARNLHQPGKGEPIDFSKVTFSFQHAGEYVEIHFSTTGCEQTWRPIGRWTGR